MTKDHEQNWQVMSWQCLCSILMKYITKVCADNLVVSLCSANSSNVEPDLATKVLRYGTCQLESSVSEKGFVGYLGDGERGEATLCQWL